MSSETQPLPVEALMRRLRRLRRQPEPFEQRPRGDSDRELQERVLTLDQRVTQLEQRVSGPLWSLIAVLVSLALGAAGARIL